MLSTLEIILYVRAIYLTTIFGKSYILFHHKALTIVPNFFLNRSPLSQVDSLLAATLIFVGAKDQKVLPETQGIALHRDLSSRFIPTELYHYPGKWLKS